LSAVTEPFSRGTVSRFFEAWPTLTIVALAWIGLMVVVALGADFLAPYSFTALDLRARLAPPVFMGGG
jgi:peptide/nickel transport system permease protein